MMFKNLGVSFSRKCLVMFWWSHQFCKLASLHPTHVHDIHLRSISCCRYSAYIRVRFWRQVRIAASYRVAFAIAKETAYNLGVTFQTVHYGLNRK